MKKYYINAIFLVILFWGFISTGNICSADGYYFGKNLKLGVIDSDVLFLQKYLNGNGFLLAQTGPGD